MTFVEANALNVNIEFPLLSAATIVLDRESAVRELGGVHTQFPVYGDVPPLIKVLIVAYWPTSITVFETVGGLGVAVNVPAITKGVERRHNKITDKAVTLIFIWLTCYLTKHKLKYVS